jgi:hypothetical protein
MFTLIILLLYSVIIFCIGNFFGKRAKEKELKKQKLIPSKELINSLVVNTNFLPDDHEEELLLLQDLLNSK